MGDPELPRRMTRPDRMTDSSYPKSLTEMAGRARRFDTSSRKAVKRGSGRWSLKGNTLELRCDGGPTVQWGIHLPPGTPRQGRPESLHFRGAQLKRASQPP